MSTWRRNPRYQELRDSLLREIVRWERKASLAATSKGKIDGDATIEGVLRSR